MTAGEGGARQLQSREEVGEEEEKNKKERSSLPLSEK